MSREKTTLLRLGDPKNPDVYLEHDPETGEITLELGAETVGYGASACGICAFIPMHLWEQIRSAEPSGGYTSGHESITLVEPHQPYERGDQFTPVPRSRGATRSPRASDDRGSGMQEPREDSDIAGSGDQCQSREIARPDRGSEVFGASAQPLEKVVILRDSGECLRVSVSLDKSEVWIGIQWQGDGYAVNHRSAEFTFSEDVWTQIRRVGRSLTSERVFP